MTLLRRIIAVALALLAIKIAADLRPPRLTVPPTGIVLTEVTVINPRGDRRPNQTIIVGGDTIDQISERPPQGKPHPFTRRYRQRYVLPGLIDMNAYQPVAFPGLRRAFGLYFLYAGVTTVRDIGNFEGDIQATERDIHDGKVGWPRLVACGRVLEGDPPLCGRSRVRDAGDAQRAVAELASAGARCIRVQWTLRADTLAAVRAAAAARRLPVVGDVPLDSGPAGSTPDDVQLVTAVRPSAPARHRSDFLSAWSTLDRAAVDALVATSLRRQITYTEALVPWLQLGRTFDANGPIDAHFNFFPRAYREVIWEAQVEATLTRLAHAAALDGRSAQQALEQALFTLQDAVRRLHQSDVTLQPAYDWASGPLARLWAWSAGDDSLDCSTP